MKGGVVQGRAVRFRQKSRMLPLVAADPPPSRVTPTLSPIGRSLAPPSITPLLATIGRYLSHPTAQPFAALDVCGKRVGTAATYPARLPIVCVVRMSAYTITRMGALALLLERAPHSTHAWTPITGVAKKPSSPSECALYRKVGRRSTDQVSHRSCHPASVGGHVSRAVSCVLLVSHADYQKGFQAGTDHIRAGAGHAEGNAADQTETEPGGSSEVCAEEVSRSGWSVCTSESMVT
jgi:hypothetical protein